MQMLTTPEIFLSFWLVGSTSMAGLFSTTKKTMFLYATCLYPFFNQWALSPINLDQVPGHSIFRVYWVVREARTASCSHKYQFVATRTHETVTLFAENNISPFSIIDLYHEISLFILKLYLDLQLCRFQSSRVTSIKTHQSRHNWWSRLACGLTWQSILCSWHYTCQQQSQCVWFHRVFHCL